MCYLLWSVTNRDFRTIFVLLLRVISPMHNLKPNLKPNTRHLGLSLRELDYTYRFEVPGNVR